MIVDVFSKPDCGKCEAAKDKIKRLGYKYREHSFEYHTSLHDGWRDDDSTGLMSWLTSNGDVKTQIPTIRIGKKYYDYPQATKELKRIKKEK